MPGRLLLRLVSVLSAAALGLGLLLVPINAPPAQAAAGDVLYMSTTGYAVKGERTPLNITWVYNGQPVTGKVNLQRQQGNTWVLVRQITVTNGAVTHMINPGASNSYRLRTSTVSSPSGVPTANPNGTSNTVSITVVTDPRRSAAPDLAASPTVVAGSRVAFTITWTVDGAPVSGVVNLQRWDGSRWVLQERVQVSNGRATTTRPAAAEASSRYRLRASSVTSHSGIVTADPHGTSGTVRVAVVGHPPSSFTVAGAGWGHGVGMSQYGAYGMALDGNSATSILRHYYTGADVAYRDTDKLVRVQVLSGVSSTQIRASGGQSRIRIGGSTVATLPAGTTITVSAVSSGLRVQANGQSWTTASASNRIHIEWASTRYFNPGSSVQVNTSVTGAQGTYRHGRLELQSIGGRVNAVNVVNVTDEYMLGIAEMPSSWSPAALQAQVIAARSYALSTMPTSVRTSCDCHLYDDTRSQNYTGWKKENESTYGVRWRSAVLATINSSGRGGVVVHSGTVIGAYYYSSSGGRTQNSEDVWVSALPYLRSVDDRWSLQSRNPYSSWTTTVTQASMRSAFGLPNVTRVVISQRSDGNAALRVTAYAVDGRSATITGEQLRSRLGLRSTWISAIS